MSRKVDYGSRQRVFPNDIFGTGLLDKRKMMEHHSLQLIQHRTKTSTFSKLKISEVFNQMRTFTTKYSEQIYEQLFPAIFSLIAETLEFVHNVEHSESDPHSSTVRAYTIYVSSPVI